MQNTKQENNTVQKRPRLVHIDMMIGLAMLLVVLGHFTVGYEPRWYHTLHNWIYSFHMQMFLFLSAFLIRYTYKPVHSIAGYLRYIWRKFSKFFIPFLLIGIIVALLACPLKGVQFSWPYLGHSLRNLLLYPRWSEASFLWYIYILFGFYLISPLFIRLPQWTKTLCCVGAMFLPMLQGGPFLDTNDFIQYTFFYCLGVLCAEWIAEIRSAKKWLWGLASMPFVAYSAWVFTQSEAIGFEHPQLGWWSLVTGTAALPFFYLLALALERTSVVRKALTRISIDCYWIYLLQMFIIWGCARLVRTAITAETLTFTPFFIVTALLAITIPILLATVCRKIFSKFQPQGHKPQQ